MKAGPSGVVVKRSEGRKVEVKRWEAEDDFEFPGLEERLEHEVEGTGEWTEVAAVLIERDEEMDWEKMDSMEEERDEAVDGRRSWGAVISRAGVSAHMSTSAGVAETAASSSSRKRSLLSRETGCAGSSSSQRTQMRPR